MAITRVAGLETDGTVWTVTFGRHIIRCLKVEGGDSLEVAFLNEIGTQAQSAQTPGTYKTDTLKITFRNSVWRAEVLPLFPKRGFGNVFVPIVVGYSHPDMGSDSDMFTGCRCTKSGVSTDNSNKPNEVPTEWTFRQMWHGNERKTRNAIDGAVATGTSKF